MNDFHGMQKEMETVTWQFDDIFVTYEDECDSVWSTKRIMASLASLAVVQPSTVKGLAGSSIAGTKLSFKPSQTSFRPKNFRLTICNIITLVEEDY